MINMVIGDLNYYNEPGTVKKSPPLTPYGVRVKNRAGEGEILTALNA